MYYDEPQPGSDVEIAERKLDKAIAIANKATDTLKKITKKLKGSDTFRSRMTINDAKNKCSVANSAMEKAHDKLNLELYWDDIRSIGLDPWD